MKILPVNLKTEHCINPLNIDIKTPRFSWMLEDYGMPGFRQSAWQLELYSGGDSLLWDSGRIEGTEGFATCPDNVLESFRQYSFSVRCWDSEGVSGISKGFFETAALDPSDLKASWISHPNPEKYYEGSWESGVPNVKSSVERSIHYMGIYCSKVISIQKKEIKRIRALVSGAGLYSLYVNGKKANDDLLPPAQTDYRKRILYSVYSLESFITEESTEYCITLVLGNGRHIALYGFDKPRGFIQILVEKKDGSVEFVCSDSTWKAGSGPLRENSIFNGERYDARLKIPEEARDIESFGLQKLYRGTDCRLQ